MNDLVTVYWPGEPFDFPHAARKIRIVHGDNLLHGDVAARLKLKYAVNGLVDSPGDAALAQQVKAAADLRFDGSHRLAGSATRPGTDGERHHPTLRDQLGARIDENPVTGRVPSDLIVSDAVRDEAAENLTRRERESAEGLAANPGRVGDMTVSERAAVDRLTDGTHDARDVRDARGVLDGRVGNQSDALRLDGRTDRGALEGNLNDTIDTSHDGREVRDGREGVALGANDHRNVRDVRDGRLAVGAEGRLNDQLDTTRDGVVGDLSANESRAKARLVDPLRATAPVPPGVLPSSGRRRNRP